MRLRNLPILFLYLAILWPIFIQPVSAQTATPIDIFVSQDRQAQTATLYFTNPVTGLSTPVVIQSFAPDKSPFEAFTVTPDGVLFRNPIDGRVLIATQNGQVIPHPFIPRQVENLLEVNWVLSPDRQQIAWVEEFLINSIWVSNVYIAGIDGSNLVQIPTPPDSQLDVFRRVMPVALSNNRDYLLLDTAFPTTIRPLTEYFTTYSDLYVFMNAEQRYQQIPGEPLCACGAGMSPLDQTILRLKNTQNGYQANLVDVRIDALLEIPPANPPFLQAGDLYFARNGLAAYYTQAGSIGDGGTQFALIRIDLTTRQQSIMLDRLTAGVDVRGVFETTGSLQGQMPVLACAGAEVRQDANPSIMHHKVIIIDNTTVITGSFNFSTSAIKDNSENLLIIQNPQIAAAYIAEFEERFAEGRVPSAEDLACPN